MIFKNRGTQIPGDFFYGGAKYLWALSMGPASSKPSDAQNFKVAPVYLENLWTPV